MRSLSSSGPSRTASGSSATTTRTPWRQAATSPPPDTLASCGNLAYAYRSAGKLKDAFPLYKRTVAGRERVLGPDHPDTLAARGNLAAAYHTARRQADAIAVFERTLADCERVLEPGHPLTKTVRESLEAATQA